MPLHAGQEDGSLTPLSFESGDPELLFTEHDRRHAYAALKQSREAGIPIVTMPVYHRLHTLKDEGNSVQAEYFLQELHNIAQQGIDTE